MYALTPPHTLHWREVFHPSENCYNFSPFPPLPLSPYLLPVEILTLPVIYVAVLGNLWIIEGYIFVCL